MAVLDHKAVTQVVHKVEASTENIPAWTRPTTALGDTDNRAILITHLLSCNHHAVT